MSINAKPANASLSTNSGWLTPKKLFAKHVEEDLRESSLVLHFSLKAAGGTRICIRLRSQRPAPLAQPATPLQAVLVRPQLQPPHHQARRLRQQRLQARLHLRHRHLQRRALARVRLEVAPRLVARNAADS
jgi:hypothetical protein